MTDTIRGPLLTAQREISALDLKRRKLQEKITQNENQEKGAYVNATTVLERVQNAAIKTGFVSNHAKLKTELAMVDAQIKEFQQQFGLEMYQILVDLEDMEGWLPTVRDIRSIYDQARRDVEKIQAKRKEKENELEKLGSTPMTNDSECSKYNEPSLPSHNGEKKNEVADEYFRQADPTLGQPPPGPAPTLPSHVNVSNPTHFNPQQVNVGLQQQQQQIQAASISAPMQYGSMAQAQADPFASSSNVMPTLITGDPFAAAPPVPNGTSAFDFMSDESGRSLGSAPAMGSGPVLGSGTNLFTPSTAPTIASNDPFSAFDTLQHPQQQQPQHTDNPMFRY